MCPQFKLSQLIVENNSFKEYVVGLPTLQITDALEYKLLKTLMLIDLCIKDLTKQQIGTTTEVQFEKAFQFALNRMQFQSLMVIDPDCQKLVWKKIHSNAKSKKEHFKYYSKFLSGREVQATLDNVIKLINDYYPRIIKLNE